MYVCIMHVELVIFLLEVVHRYYKSWCRVLLTDKKLERVETYMKNRKKTRTTQGKQQVCPQLLSL